MVDVKVILTSIFTFILNSVVSFIQMETTLRQDPRTELSEYLMY